MPENWWHFFFLRQERNANGGTHVTRDHNNIRNTTKLCKGIWNKRHAVLRYSVIPWQCLSTYSCSHSSAAGEFQLGVVDHPPYSPDLHPNDCHLFIYLKSWLISQLFNKNEELMEGVRIWLSSQVTYIFGTSIHKLIPQYNYLSCGGDNS
jgi:hypothetical protein